MAETNFSPPYQGSFTVGPRPQDTNPPAQPLLPPAYPSNYATNQTSYNIFNSPFGGSFPEQPLAQFPYVHPNRYQNHFVLNGGPRMPGYHQQPPPPGTYQHTPTRASHPHSLPPTGRHTGVVGHPDNGNLLPMMEPPQPQSYLYPPYPSPPIATSSTTWGRRHSSVIPPTPAPPSRHYSNSAIQPSMNNIGSMENIGVGNPDQPRQVTSPPNRRTSYEGAFPHHINRVAANPERRSLAFISAQNRRSNRSISPRASNRRNYDRYSTDLSLSQSSTSSDAEEAAARAAPFSRARHRIREVRPRHFGHGHFGHVDANIPSPRQIQDLKAKLKRMLPSELPKDASKTCDICQKDYHAKHVPPSEEEEIAIELSCGHRFGEFCISEWFDTCKTHKNKVTCPMCRKVLIEPIRQSPAYPNVYTGAFGWGSRSSPSPPPFEHLLANELRADFPSQM